jgi:hypothetical protein
MGHEVIKLRELLPVTTSDDEVLRLAGERGALLITCNRDDFLAAASRVPHRGIIILIRRKTRARERAVAAHPPFFSESLFEAARRSQRGHGEQAVFGHGAWIDSGLRKASAKVQPVWYPRNRDWVSA